MAAAKTNHLFGEAPSPQHARLDLPRLHKEAEAYIRGNEVFRGLVVQSLRVASQLHFMETSKANVVGANLLEEFGPQFPAPPNPALYQALVNRALEDLPLKSQAELRSRLGVLRH